MVEPIFWSPKEHSPLLEVVQGVRIKYFGSGDTDKDAAAVRTNRPVSPSCGLFYFEVTLLDRGRDGFIAVGISGPTASTARLPGVDKCSWGYHADSGMVFANGNSGTRFGPTFSTGDVVGCGINFMDMSCFFTKNGTCIGTAFQHIGAVAGEAPYALYPCVGLRTPGEIEANFGQAPFMFDVASKRKELETAARARVEAEVLRGGWRARLNQLVTSYLVHHGYRETAMVFARDSQCAITESDSSIRARQRIREHILAGEIDQAILTVNETYGRVFHENPDLQFRLLVRKFVELVSAQTGFENLEGLLSFGQQLQSMCDQPQFNTEANRKALQDAFSLLAYSNPRVGPVAHLLDANLRMQLAEALNAAIIGTYSLSTEPTLERLLQQASVCLSELQRLQVGTAGFLSVEHYL